MTGSTRPWLWSLGLSCVGAFACTGDDTPADSLDDTTSVGDGDGDPGDGDGDPGDGDGDPGDGDGDPGDGDGDPGELVEVRGDAFAFGPDAMVPGATVTILELAGEQTTTDADGHFEFPGLPAGSLATFVFSKTGYPRIYTKTFTLPATGLVDRVTFQAPDDVTFAALGQIVQIDPDPATCQIASTVTRVGKSLYDDGAHGEAGATVTISPALDPSHGPVYFNASVIPQLDLVETSEDGGVLFTNVPPGTYVLSASKAGVSFEDVTVRCDADVLVNPSPPYGLQAL